MVETRQSKMDAIERQRMSNALWVFLVDRDLNLLDSGDRLREYLAPQIYGYSSKISTLTSWAA